MSHQDPIWPDVPEPPIQNPEPARPDESALAFTMLRASMVTLLARRKGRMLTVTEREREKIGPAMLRITMERDLTIRLWLEDPPKKGRSGVVYVPGPSRKPRKSGGSGGEAR